MNYDNRFYLGVEFFFIESGWLLASGFQKRREDPGSYIVRRIKKLYPYYFIGFVLGMISLEKSIRLRFFLVRWHELLALYGIGFATSSDKIAYNPPSWYVSSLLLTSFIIYVILDKWGEKYIKYVAPLFCLFLYASCFRYTPDITNYALNFNLGLFDTYARPFAAMNLGLISWYITQRLLAQYSSEKIRMALSCAGSVVLIAAVVLSYDIRYTSFDCLCVLLMFIGISMSFVYSIKVGEMFGKTVTFINKMVICIYLNHYPLLCFELGRREYYLALIASATIETFILEACVLTIHKRNDKIS